jgi:phosphatidate cytidylyltransferase
MLVERILVAAVMLPVVALVTVAGDWVFALSVAITLSVAAWEFWRMVRTGGFQPSPVLLIGGVGLMAILRYFFDFTGSQFGASILILLTMAACTRGYELSRNQSASDFAITMAGIFYLGWLGSYLISLRNLPAGEWWAFTALPAAWLADGGAYFVGRAIGRHKLSPRVSPKKTWEGYLGGIPVAVIGCALLATAWQLRVPAITPLKGALLGLVVSILAPMGDLGESMLKRQFGIKDSSNLLPGHGGFMDRIDSTLWAAVIGYYLIVFFKFGG